MIFKQEEVLEDGANDIILLIILMIKLMYMAMQYICLLCIGYLLYGCEMVYKLITS